MPTSTQQDDDLIILGDETGTDTSMIDFNFGDTDVSTPSQEVSHDDVVILDDESISETSQTETSGDVIDLFGDPVVDTIETQNVPESIVSEEGIDFDSDIDSQSEMVIDLGVSIDESIEGNVVDASTQDTNVPASSQETNSVFNILGDEESATTTKEAPEIMVPDQEVTQSTDDVVVDFSINDAPTETSVPTVSQESREDILSATVAKMEERKSAILDQKSDIQAEIDAKNEQIKLLQQEVKELKSEMSDLETEESGIEADIQALEGMIQGSSKNTPTPRKREPNLKNIKK